MPTPSRMELRCISGIAWVQHEMEKQKAKWGEQNVSPLRYYATLAEEFGEVGDALNKIMEGTFDIERGMDHVEYELIQTAAVAVSFVEAIRRAKGTHDLRTPITFMEKESGNDKA
jgi:NTP pyrophosphatase (non-canonical NTP hydrolase)